MTTLPIHIPRNSPPAVLCEDLDAIEVNGKVPAGHFEFFKRQDRDDAGIFFGCPCGCGEMHSLDFRPHDGRRPSWEWNGNRERPTLTPSVNILQFDEAGNRVGEHWHGWLTDGQWRSC